jgi:2-dehydropantoate 2-reductase
MACLFAARLSAAGERVALLDDWAEGLQALRSHGVRLLDETGATHAYPIQVIEPSQPGPPVEVALVLVKTWQTQCAAQQLENHLRPNGLALTLQNGLGNYERLAQVLGARRAAAGVTTLGATLLEPGLVQAHGAGEIILPEAPAQLAALADRFRRAQFNVTQTGSLESLMWGKLVANAAINPITALLDVPNGFTVENEPARTLLTHLAEETAAVARALEISLPFERPAEYVLEIARLTAANSSSMRQDLRRGAPTEIDSINGAVVRAARSLGMHAPYNEAMWHMIRAKVNSITPAALDSSAG